MILFLTSSPTGPLDNSRDVDGFDDKNRMVEKLREFWKAGSRCLLISAEPDDAEFNDIIADDMRRILSHRGFSFDCVDVLDRRTRTISRETLHAYDVLFMGGGHVPTQNRFLHEMDLREKMRGFHGIVLGISAGTMNCAATVYAQPEHPGESLDPDYVRFIPGLGLTGLNILPHYQMLKDSMLDGKRLFEGITYPDSAGRSFLALPDGSYVLSVDGRETLYGEAWLISEGNLLKICEEDATLALN